MENIKEMTGESYYGSRKRFNEVVLNGDTGRFTVRDKDAEKDKETGKYPREELGSGIVGEFDKQTGKLAQTGNEPLSVVFLKIRRVLSSYNPTTGNKRTSEHNYKGDRVVLYGTNPTETGIASELRDKYPDLHTQQIVYSFVPSKKEVVKVVVKGASLGSQKDVEGVLKFYDYLQTFKDDEHFYQYETLLVAQGEEGPKGTYYAITFKRGEKLSEEMQKEMVEKIKELHTMTTEQDASVSSRVKSEDIEEAPQGEPVKEIEYPTEDIKPEDIPF